MKKKISILLMVFVLVMSLGVFGDVTQGSNSGKKLDDVKKDLLSGIDQDKLEFENGKPAGVNNLIINETSIDEKYFNALTKESQKEVADKLYSNYVTKYENQDNVSQTVKNLALDALKSISNSSSRLGSMMLNRLSSTMQPDFIGASKVINPFQRPIGVIVGIIIMGIYMALAVTIVLDLAYIGIPAFTAFMGMDVTKQDDNNKDKFNWRSIISNDAKNALKAKGDGQTSTGTAMLKYFKGRIFFFLVFAFVSYYLVFGKMFELIGIILDFFNGIIGV